jgi:hypothetical protein
MESVYVTFSLIVCKLYAVAELFMLILAVIKHNPHILANAIQNSTSLNQMLQSNYKSQVVLVFGFRTKYMRSIGTR